MVDATGAWSYGELHGAVDAAAAWLTELEVRSGDRVLLVSENCRAYVALLFACARLGVCLQPVSWRLAPPEIAYQLEDAEPSLLLAAAEHEALARPAGPADHAAGITECLKNMSAFVGLEGVFFTSFET